MGCIDHQAKQLRQAINQRDVVQAKMLLDRGVDPNATNLAGNTAMHRAVISGDVALVDLVLAYKPDLQAQNYAGRTPGALTDYLGDRDTAAKLGHETRATGLGVGK